MDLFLDSSDGSVSLTFNNSSEKCLWICFIESEIPEQHKTLSNVSPAWPGHQFLAHFQSGHFHWPFSAVAIFSGFSNPLQMLRPIFNMLFG
jgi:hypothetical protein